MLEARVRMVHLLGLSFGLFPLCKVAVLLAFCIFSFDRVLASFFLRSFFSFIFLGKVRFSGSFELVNEEVPTSLEMGF